ncbi:hypothetical protein Mgra_00001400 [Meloidogyne graminicola]|uniref:Uncharacterized protein n=1 Tax=Meloidogyne graminicola TaxID=189291 RepID=A0A8S9ZZX8_9BILA|nr:hypothetical protein Mgra_00001400 [Meloidogyne graminicola]
MLRIGTKKNADQRGFGVRSKYRNVISHRTRRDFTAWWDTQREGWKLNTRYDTVDGGYTEYWNCAHRQEGIYTCPSRLKINFGRRGIHIEESRNRPHDHSPLQLPTVENEIPMKTKVIEPLPMQTAQIVDLTPRLVTSTSTQSTEQTLKESTNVLRKSTNDP